MKEEEREGDAGVNDGKEEKKGQQQPSLKVRFILALDGWIGCEGQKPPGQGHKEGTRHEAQAQAQAQAGRSCFLPSLTKL